MAYPLDNGKRQNYEAIVMGVSSGGFVTLETFFASLSEQIRIPLIIVQHLHPQQSDFHIRHFDRICALPVKEPNDKEPIMPGFVYMAPPNYHLLIEEDACFALSVDSKVNFSRPSVDVLFYSAVDCYGAGTIGVVMTGANSDGSRGLAQIKAHGGLAIVQDPKEAQVSEMPEAALQLIKPDYILPVVEIAKLLNNLGTMPKK